MMAAFDVQSLKDWGYDERTKFLDPMEDKYRSKNEDDSEHDKIKDTLKKFMEMEAYNDVDKLEKALEDYYRLPKTPLSTVTVSSTASVSSTSSSAAGAALTTSAPAAALTVASDKRDTLITSAVRATSTKSSSTRRTTTSKKK